MAYSRVFVALLVVSSGVATAADVDAKRGEVDESTAALIQILPSLDDPAAVRDILAGIHEGLSGRGPMKPPSGWAQLYRQHLAKSPDEKVRQIAQMLALQFGDMEVVAVQMKQLAYDKTPFDARRQALAALLEIRAEGLAAVLHKLLRDEPLRLDVLGALGELTHADTPRHILRVYPQLNVQEKRAAIATLSTRVAYAHALLDAVADGQIPRQDLTAESIRRLRLLNDDAVLQAIAKHWGSIRETPQQRAEQIAKTKQLLEASVDRPPNHSHGRMLFNKTCQQCHKLYDEGGEVGPDITGSNRGDLDYLLVNILDPNATVGRDYQAWSVVTESGKLHVGLLVRETDKVVTLRTETDEKTISKDTIQEIFQTDVSMMPEGLLDQLSENDIRDLFAYLRHTQQVPLED